MAEKSFIPLKTAIFKIIHNFEVLPRSTHSSSTSQKPVD